MELFRLSPIRKSQLAVSAILVFIIGVVTLFTTRYIHMSVYPEDFLRHYPTISRTGSIDYYPANIVFGIGMCAVSICILITTRIGYQATLSLARNSPHNRYYLIHLMAYAFQLFAGVFLALLAIINSGINGQLHTQFSLAFFTCQAFAIILEATARRASNITIKCLGGREKIWDAFRDTQSIITIILVVFLLWLHMRDNYFLDSKWLHRHLYVWIEYTTSVLYFSYSATCYVQIRDYYLQQEAV